MWDDRIDEEIDAAAREVTTAEPPGGLRARVLARIDEAPAARLWSWPVVAVPAVVILLAVVLVRSGWRPEPHDVPLPHATIATTHDDGGSGFSRTGGAAAQTTAASAVASVRAAARLPAPTNQTNDVDLTLSPLTVESIQVPAIAVPEATAPESIAVTPLTLTPLSPEGEK